MYYEILNVRGSLTCSFGPKMPSELGEHRCRTTPAGPSRCNSRIDTCPSRRSLLTCSNNPTRDRTLTDLPAADDRDDLNEEVGPTSVTTHRTTRRDDHHPRPPTFMQNEDRSRARSGDHTHNGDDLNARRDQRGGELAGSGAKVEHSRPGGITSDRLQREPDTPAKRSQYRPR